MRLLRTAAGSADEMQLSAALAAAALLGAAACSRCGLSGVAEAATTLLSGTAAEETTEPAAPVPMAVRGESGDGEMGDARNPAPATGDPTPSRSIAPNP